MRFYAPTAFHGAHVVAGVLWAIYVIRGARKGKYKDGKYLGVEIFGLFWHFVDVVWIVLFTVIYLV
jgi:heme/copper-type cytochrome/quinol oxidase subunit 3